MEKKLSKNPKVKRFSTSDPKPPSLDSEKTFQSELCTSATAPTKTFLELRKKDVAKNEKFLPSKKEKAVSFSPSKARTFFLLSLNLTAVNKREIASSKLKYDLI
jgi:hypothetical protein